MSEPVPGSSSDQLKILVVDDDPLILMSTVDMLEDAGHAVVGVCSALQALDQLKADRFDVLVTDHAMPKMSGAELIAEARGQCPDLAMVLATGYAELPQGEKVDALRVTKPFIQAELVKTVRAAEAARAVPERTAH